MPTNIEQNQILADLQREYKDIVKVPNNLFKELFTRPELGVQIQKIQATLEKENPILNPGRTPVMRWNSKFSAEEFMSNEKNAGLNRERNMIIISMALDDLYAERFKKMESNIQKINNSPEGSKMMHDLRAQGQIEHIKHQLPHGNYHQGFHPRESAVIAGAMANKIRKDENNTLVTDLVEVGFEFHDVDQGYVKTDGMNELRSADRLAASWTANLEKRNFDNPKEQSEYQSLIPYMAWKKIVAGTTMMKGIDGQPTLHIAQQLVESQLAESQIDEYKNRPKTSLDAAAWIMSLVDSNLPALAKFMMGIEDLKLPAKLIHAGQALADQSAGILKLAGNSTNHQTINEAGLAFGQNGRMFPEIHTTFQGALFNAQMEPVNGKVMGNGVDLWNAAIVAIRQGNNELLASILSARLTKELSTPGGKIPVGSTLMDIFIHRSASEVTFSNGQGPELHEQALASSNIKEYLKPGELEINDHVWKEHAQRLQDLKNGYESGNPAQREELAKAFFSLGGTQPEVFLNNKDKIIENIDKEIELLGQELAITKLKPTMNALESAQPSHLAKGTGTIMRGISHSTPQHAVLDRGYSEAQINQYIEILEKTKKQYQAINPNQPKEVQAKALDTEVAPPVSNPLVNRSNHISKL